MARFLVAGGYDRLRRATRTYRADLVVRLCGEVGLRPSEVVSVGPDDVRAVGDARFLDAGGRDAYLPAEVAHTLEQYARSVDDADPLVDVSERRVQMLVRETGERAADATDDGRFRDVSTRDLRAAHACRLLDDGTDPRVVLAVTAYDRLETLEPHLDSPDAERVAAALSGDASAADRPPARLEAAVTVAAAVGDALADAATSADVHELVCERVAAADAYRFAWTAAATGDGVELRAAAGTDADAVERTLADREAAVAATTDDRTARVAETETGTVVAVPLTGGGSVRGLLGVGVDADGVGAAERDALSALGAQVGAALAAVEHKRLLLADTVTELTFDVASGAAPLASAAAELDCEFDLVGIVPAEDLLCYVDARDVTPDAVSEYAAATDAVGNVRLVGGDAVGVLLELALASSPVRTIADSGGDVRSYGVAPRGGRLVAELSTDANARSVVEAVTGSFPGVHLTAKREAEPEAASGGEVRERLADDLTERQAAALRSAYYGGYFEWPRDSTGEELADSLGVSSPTLHRHLRTAQQKLLRAFLEDD
ncbi:bacterio-opsin activator-like protein [Candidatus Halobonum tyrrellensis G22]|uniref:Bacterio-opsin activator-like protein n=2 Tax=Candidatus Halobonum TaxID=1431544 RepID=V4IV13_9EURY|nr:bacterio-opsin activator-like protein [Candidatus Halobonum tyrrellensis G22]